MLPALVRRITPISIHAPLTECDVYRRYCRTERLISIHAPLTECDSASYSKGQKLAEFQSTHP